MSDLVLFEQHDEPAPVVDITINRPEKRNAIDYDLLTDLCEAVDRAEKIAGLRAIRLRGAGTCFSAGIDLSSFFSMQTRFGDGWRDNLLPLTQAFQQLVSRFERCALPTIALLHGHTIGLGLEIALACDLRVAAEGTRMALPEAKLGMIPDVGGTTRLARLIGPARAKEVIMTGREVTLDEADAWGMINHRVPADQLQAKADELLTQLRGAAPLAASYAKRVIDGLFDVDRGLQLEALAQAHLINTEDFQIGAQAMMTKQPPQWKGK